MQDNNQEPAGATEAGSPQGDAVALSGIAKTFGPKRVLSPFSLNLHAGRIHALLGQNGSGKSTLIKILTGVYEPDDAEQATVEVAGSQLEFGSPRSSLNLGFRVVHQDLGLVGESSVLDNLAFGQGYKTKLGTIDKKKASADARSLLDGMSLDAVDQKAKIDDLSAAQKTGVAIARAMRPGSTPTTLLILDEPTATLPAREVARLESMLKSSAREGIAILYVTHHLDEVFRLADDVSVLRDGNLVLSAEVKNVTPDDVVTAVVGSAVEPVRRAEATREARATEVVLEVNDLFGPALRGVDLRVHAGEIVGLYGLTGSGRESLLATIFGGLARDSGGVRVVDVELRPGRPDLAVRAGVAYLPPDRKLGGGLMTMSATENLTLPALGAFFKRGFLRKKREIASAQEWMDRLEVRPAGAAENTLASFSGGNQQKVLIGKWMRLLPKLFLLDEPTQGVDVGAKASLHRQIMAASQEGAAILVNSTDAEELAVLCDRVLILTSGRITGQVDREHLSVTELDRRLIISTTSKAA